MGNLKNLEQHQFKKGQSGNPNGQPRKTVSWVNKELANQGYDEARPRDIKECYLRLINLSLKELDGLIEDTHQPALAVVVAKAIKSDKGFEIIEKILDRTIGKPQQSVDLTTGGDKLQYPTKIEASYRGVDISITSDDI